MIKLHMIYLLFFCLPEFPIMCRFREKKSKKNRINLNRKNCSQWANLKDFWESLKLFKILLNILISKKNNDASLT